MTWGWQWNKHLVDKDNMDSGKQVESRAAGLGTILLKFGTQKKTQCENVDF